MNNKHTTVNTMEQSVESFRQELITQNPDVTTTKEVTLVSAIEDAYKAMDVLTDILLAEMEDTSCISCAKMHSSSFGEMRLAFNAVAELRDAHCSDDEEHEVV